MLLKRNLFSSFDWTVIQLAELLSSFGYPQGYAQFADDNVQDFLTFHVLISNAWFFSFFFLKVYIYFFFLKHIHEAASVSFSTFYLWWTILYEILMIFSLWILCSDWSSWKDIWDLDAFDLHSLLSLCI